MGVLNQLGGAGAAACVIDGRHRVGTPVSGKAAFGWHRIDQLGEPYGAPIGRLRADDHDVLKLRGEPLDFLDLGPDAQVGVRAESDQNFGVG